MIRIQAGNKSYYVLGKILGDRSLFMEFKKQLGIHYLDPPGNSVWRGNMVTEKIRLEKIFIAGRKILRKIFGPNRDRISGE